VAISGWIALSDGLIDRKDKPSAGSFRNYEISLLAAAWLVPLLSRSVAGFTGVPLGLMVLLLTFACTMRRAAGDARALPGSQSTECERSQNSASVI
jgi:hypothetical protein